MTTRPTQFTYQELLRTGLDDAAIQRALRDGSLVRIRRGVYARLATGLTPEETHMERIRGTVGLVNPDNVVSHISAAILHGLPVQRSQLQRVTMIRRSAGHSDRTDSLLVRDTRLDDDEVTLVDGLRVTTLGRTVADLARTQDFLWGVCAADAALGLGIPAEELLAQVNRHPKLRGLQRARIVLDAADGRSQSAAESISRIQFARHGIPTPELQFEVINHLGVVVATTDFGWPELGLVGEVDGKWKYGKLLKPGQDPENAIMNEKFREEEIRLAGWWPFRWDWAVANDGPELARRFHRATQNSQRRAA